MVAMLQHQVGALLARRLIFHKDYIISLAIGHFYTLLQRQWQSYGAFIYLFFKLDSTFFLNQLYFIIFFKRR